MADGASAAGLFVRFGDGKQAGHETLADAVAAARSALDEDPTTTVHVAGEDGRIIESFSNAKVLVAVARHSARVDRANERLAGCACLLILCVAHLVASATPGRGWWPTISFSAAAVGYLIVVGCRVVTALEGFVLVGTVAVCVAALVSSHRQGHVHAVPNRSTSVPLATSH